MTRSCLRQALVFEIGQLIDKDVDLFLQIRQLELEREKTRNLKRQKLEELQS